MTMNPRLAEQLAASKMHDFEQAVAGRQGVKADPGESAPSTARHHQAARRRALGSPSRRGTVARRVGVLLISVGRRLAEPDGFPAAFNGPRQPG